jgi:hypothetical protein
MSGYSRTYIQELPSGIQTIAGVLTVGWAGNLFQNSFGQRL